MQSVEICAPPLKEISVSNDTHQLQPKWLPSVVVTAIAKTKAFFIKMQSVETCAHVLVEISEILVCLDRHQLQIKWLLLIGVTVIAKTKAAFLYIDAIAGNIVTVLTSSETLMLVFGIRQTSVATQMVAVNRSYCDCQNQGWFPLHRCNR